MNETVTVAAEAMATRFEIALHGDPVATLRAGAEEALAEITRLESMLSLFEPTSEISHINVRAAREPVPVSPEVFILLKRCIDLSKQTKGAFDITIAPPMKCWRFVNDTGSVPTENEIVHACALVGIEQVKLNSPNSTVQLNHEGVMLDLGSIGKGYALEQASKLLLENLCDMISRIKKEIKIYNPRLPKMDTDQTNEILKYNIEENHIIMDKSINKFVKLFN